jgi:hypothetical protein
MNAATKKEMVCLPFIFGLAGGYYNYRRYILNKRSI